MKKRIWFVLLLLGITPFARSCSITAGFPLPVATNVGFGGVDLCPGSALFLLADIAILSLIAFILVKRRQTIRWLSSFYNVLLINLAASWAGFLLISGYVDEPPAPVNALVNGILIYLCKVPGMVAYKFFYKSRYQDVADDILYRAWFVIVTIALTIIVYQVKQLRGRSSGGRTSARKPARSF